jgi:hypothetical protein
MLYGKWQVVEGEENRIDLLKVVKGEKTIQNWGHFIEFYEDGTYNEHASAPCGLDDNRFSYQGKWSYDKKSKTIELKDIVVNSFRPNIYNKYTVLTSGAMVLLSVKPNELKTKVTKPWEKVSAKK